MAPKRKIPPSDYAPPGGTDAENRERDPKRLRQDRSSRTAASGPIRRSNRKTGAAQRSPTWATQRSPPIPKFSRRSPQTPEEFRQNLSPRELRTLRMYRYGLTKAGTAPGLGSLDPELNDAEQFRAHQKAVKHHKALYPLSPATWMSKYEGFGSHRKAGRGKNVSRGGPSASSFSDIERREIDDMNAKYRVVSPNATGETGHQPFSLFAGYEYDDEDDLDYVPREDEEDVDLSGLSEISDGFKDLSPASQPGRRPTIASGYLADGEETPRVHFDEASEPHRYDAVSRHDEPRIHPPERSNQFVKDFTGYSPRSPRSWARLEQEQKAQWLASQTHPEYAYFLAQGNAVPSPVRRKPRARLEPYQEEQLDKEDEDDDLNLALTIPEVAADPHFDLGPRDAVAFANSDPSLGYRYMTGPRRGGHMPGSPWAEGGPYWEDPNAVQDEDEEEAEGQDENQEEPQGEEAESEDEEGESEDEEEESDDDLPAAPPPTREGPPPTPTPSVPQDPQSLAWPFPDNPDELDEDETEDEEPPRQRRRVSPGDRFDRAAALEQLPPLSRSQPRLDPNDLPPVQGPSRHVAFREVSDRAATLGQLPPLSRSAPRLGRNDSPPVQGPSRRSRNRDEDRGAALGHLPPLPRTPVRPERPDSPLSSDGEVVNWDDFRRDAAAGRMPPPPPPPPGRRPPGSNGRRARFTMPAGDGDGGSGADEEQNDDAEDNVDDEQDEAGEESRPHGPSRSPRTPPPYRQSFLSSRAGAGASIREARAAAPPLSPINPSNWAIDDRATYRIDNGNVTRVAPGFRHVPDGDNPQWLPEDWNGFQDGPDDYIYYEDPIGNRFWRAPARVPGYPRFQKTHFYGADGLLHPINGADGYQNPTGEPRGGTNNPERVVLAQQLRELEQRPPTPPPAYGENTTRDVFWQPYAEGEPDSPERRARIARARERDNTRYRPEYFNEIHGDRRRISDDRDTRARGNRPPRRASLPLTPGGRRFSPNASLFGAPPRPPPYAPRTPPAGRRRASSQALSDILRGPPSVSPSSHGTSPRERRLDRILGNDPWAGTEPLPDIDWYENRARQYEELHGVEGEQADGSEEDEETDGDEDEDEGTDDAEDETDDDEEDEDEDDEPPPPAPTSLLSAGRQPRFIPRRARFITPSDNGGGGDGRSSSSPSVPLSTDGMSPNTRRIHDLFDDGTPSDMESPPEADYYDGQQGDDEAPDEHDSDGSGDDDEGSDGGHDENADATNGDAQGNQDNERQDSLASYQSENDDIPIPNPGQGRVRLRRRRLPSGAFPERNGNGFVFRRTSTNRDIGPLPSPAVTEGGIVDQNLRYDLWRDGLPYPIPNEEEAWHPLNRVNRMYLPEGWSYTQHAFRPNTYYYYDAEQRRQWYAPPALPGVPNMGLTHQWGPSGVLQPVGDDTNQSYPGSPTRSGDPHGLPISTNRPRGDLVADANRPAANQNNFGNQQPPVTPPNPGSRAGPRRRAGPGRRAGPRQVPALVRTDSDELNVDNGGNLPNPFEVNGGDQQNGANQQNPNWWLRRDGAPQALGTPTPVGVQQQPQQDGLPVGPNGNRAWDYIPPVAQLLHEANEEEMITLQADNRALRQRIQEQEARINILDVQLPALQDENARAANRIQVLTQERDHALQQRDNAVLAEQNQTQNLEREWYAAEAFRQDAEAQRARANNLTVDLERQRYTAEGFRQDAQAQLTRADNRTADLERVERYLTDLENQLEERDQQIAERDQQIEDLMNEIAEVDERERGNNAQRPNDPRSPLRNSRSPPAQPRRSPSAAGGEGEDSDDDPAKKVEDLFRDLTQKLDDCRKHGADLQRQLDECRARGNTLQGDLNQSQVDAETAETSARERERELEQQVEHLRDEVEASRDVRGQPQTASDVCRKKCEDLEKKVQKLKEEAAKCRREMDRAHEKLAQEQQKPSRDADAAQREYERAERLEGQIERWRESLEAEKAKVAKLEAALKNAGRPAGDDDDENCEGRCRRAEAALQEREEQLEALQDDYRDLANENERLEAEFDSSSSGDIRALREEIKKLKVIGRKKADEAATLQKKLDECEKHRKRADKEAEAAKKGNKSAGPSGAANTGAGGRRPPPGPRDRGANPGRKPTPAGGNTVRGIPAGGNLDNALRRGRLERDENGAFKRPGDQQEEEDEEDEGEEEEEEEEEQEEEEEEQEEEEEEEGDEEQGGDQSSGDSASEHSEPEGEEQQGPPASDTSEEIPPFEEEEELSDPSEPNTDDEDEGDDNAGAEDVQGRARLTPLPTEMRRSHAHLSPHPPSRASSIRTPRPAIPSLHPLDSAPSHPFAQFPRNSPHRSPRDRNPSAAFPVHVNHRPLTPLISPGSLARIRDINADLREKLDASLMESETLRMSNKTVRDWHHEQHVGHAKLRTDFDDLLERNWVLEKGQRELVEEVGLLTRELERHGRGRGDVGGEKRKRSREGDDGYADRRDSQRKRRR